MTAHAPLAHALAPGDELAERLRAVVAGFGLPFGAERSVKLRAGEARHGRALFSLALGPDPRGQLLAAAEALGAPQAAVAPLLPWAGAASHLHVGAEPPATAKLYLEFAAPPPRRADLVFLAAKWRVDGAAPRALATYSRRDEPLESLLARLAPAPLHAPLRALAARTQTPPRALEVAEPPSPRLSLDLNVYDADLTLAEAAAEIRALHAALSAPGADALLAAHGAEPLGHVAAGVSRDGAPFATIYFGGGPG
ncbi:hypothetical protein [Albimonas pacifica]|uniref:Tryptophan halogenase n=1 Tax=Albimonas pacifica TaxID=1114924 RepID=A0A1I3HUN8_9RHOB|nr:hypothetical protein [Albimonas pacifica]SFI39434.1 tryptophan halogenase [Albimonas pacifica]